VEGAEVGSVEAWRTKTRLGKNELYCSCRVGRDDGGVCEPNGLASVEKKERVGWYVVGRAVLAMGMLSWLALGHMSDAMA